MNRPLATITLLLGLSCHAAHAQDWNEEFRRFSEVGGFRVFSTSPSYTHQTSSATLVLSFDATVPAAFAGSITRFPQQPLRPSVTATMEWTAPFDPDPTKTYNVSMTLDITDSGATPEKSLCTTSSPQQTVPRGQKATVTAALSCTVAELGVFNSTQSRLTVAARLFATGLGNVQGDGVWAYYEAVPDPNPSPRVTGITPDFAPNTVTGIVFGDGFFTEPLTAIVSGSNFRDGASVSLGDGIAASAVRFKSTSQLEVDLKGFHNAREGLRDVVVRNPDGKTGTGTGLFHVTSVTVAPLEVNQGVAVTDCTASTPCVADHATVIRVRPSCNGTGCEVGKEQTRGRLHVLTSAGRAPIAGSPFTAQPDLVRILPSGTEAPLAERSAARDALNFVFPGGLPAGSYDLVFEFDPKKPTQLPPRLSRPDPGTNLARMLTGQVFQKSRADRRLRIGVIIDSALMTRGRPNPQYAAAINSVLDNFEMLRAAYPISADLVRADRMPCSATMQFDDEESAWPDIIACFRAVAGGDSANPYTHAFLFTNQLAAPGVSDCNGTSCRSPSAIVLLEGTANTHGTVAHELGHHFLLGDTYTNQSGANPNPSVNPPEDVCFQLGNGCPVEPGSLDNLLGTVSVTSTGFSTDRTLQKRDFMGNAPRPMRWVDKRSWNHIYRSLMRSGRPHPLADPGERIVLSGVVRRDGTASFYPFTRFTGAALSEDVAPGEYVLELQGSSGNVLFSLPFELSFETVHRETEASSASFLFTLAFPQGTTRVALRRAGVELASRSLSASAPTVRLTSPNGGESLGESALVSWTASDADGDALTYDLLYSVDGAAFTPLVTGLTSTSYEWFTEPVAGSQNARLRVVASDGFQQSSDESDAPFSVPAKSPSATILSPPDGAVLEQSQGVTFHLSGYDPEDGSLPGSALSLSSSVAGALGSGRSVFATLAPGAHTVTLTARDSSGNTATASISLTVIAKPAGSPDQTRFVPIVLATEGVGGSFFTSELTLTNRGTKDATVAITYTQAFGGGGGTAYDLLRAGTQRIVPDALAYLASRGAVLPPEGNRGGTLSVAFFGLSSPEAGAATVRTATPVADGRAGLSYPAVPPQLLSGPVTIAGLRQNATDRSNVALMNAGTSGDVVLRLTVVSGDPAVPLSRALPDVGLRSGGFAQISGILTSNGLSLSNGYVRVERVSGSAPFYAYGVINDQVTSDGSFIPPVLDSSLTGKTSLALPVIVETGPFSSELVVTNTSSAPRSVRLAFVSEAIPAADKTATLTLALGAFEQRILPTFVQVLRDRGVPGIGPAGTTYAGALFASVPGGDVQGVFVGARTSSAAPSGSGSYGLFYTGVPSGAAASSAAWVYGLQQNDQNRGNLALVNTGDVDQNGSAYRIELYDGDTGALARTIETSLPARGWTQLSRILTQYAPGVTNAYARVVKTSGNNQMLVYGVINDGGAPGERSGDGAFVTMERE